MIYVCNLCKWELDETKGNARHKIPAGINFEELSKDFSCPICGSPNFSKKQDNIKLTPKERVKILAFQFLSASKHMKNRSMKEISRLSGIEYERVYYILLGERIPSLREAFKISEVLKINLDDDMKKILDDFSKDESLNIPKKYGI